MAQRSPFGAHPSTLYRWIKLGRLRSYRRMGDRRTLVDMDELRPLLEPHPRQEQEEE